MKLHAETGYEVTDGCNMGGEERSRQHSTVEERQTHRELMMICDAQVEHTDADLRDVTTASQESCRRRQNTV